MVHGKYTDMPSLKLKITPKSASVVPDNTLLVVPVVPKMRKKYKFKSGTVSLREIKKMQKTTKLLIQYSPFKRIIKELTQYLTKNIIYQRAAIEALQEAAEDYIIDIFKSANKQAKYGKRKTITVGDMQMSI